MFSLDRFAEYLAKFDYSGANGYLVMHSRESIAPTLVKLTIAEESYFSFEYLNLPLRRKQTLLNIYLTLKTDSFTPLDLFIEMRIRLIDLYMYLPLKLFTYNDIAVSASISLLKTLNAEKDRLGGHVWLDILLHEIEALTNLLISNQNLAAYNYFDTVIHYHKGITALQKWKVDIIKTKVEVYNCRI
jgi:hypothetical protein